MTESSAERQQLGPGLWLALVVGRWLIATLFRLNRIEVRGLEFLEAALASDRPVYIGLWHGRLLYPIWYLRQYTPSALTSPSSDGELIDRLLRGWGYRTFRGSTTQLGRQALRQMGRLLENPETILVNAMDGPLGPPKVAKAGSLAVAARKGAVLLPVSGAANRRWTFEKSWDRFQLPKPFGRIVIQFGPPLEATPETDADTLARLMSQQCNELEVETDALTAYVG